MIFGNGGGIMIRIRGLSALYSLLWFVAMSAEFISRRFVCACLLTVAVATVPFFAHAQDSSADSFPPAPQAQEQPFVEENSAATAESFGDSASPLLDEDTHPMLRLTPDKSQLLTLERNAASIIVGNDQHLGVLMDSPRLVVLVPRSPGATYFTVLDEKRNIIMQRHVIVDSPKAQYVRVRKSCGIPDPSNGNASENCTETNVYYCPDMCHPILGFVPEENASSASAGTSTETSASGSDLAGGMGNITGGLAGGLGGE